MERERVTPSVVSLSSVLSALSYALDLTEGQPTGHTVRSCVIGMRLAQGLGLKAADREALYYALLLKDAGCSTNSAMVANYFGSDDRAVKQDLKMTNWTRSVDRVVHALRNAARGLSFAERIRQVTRMAGGGPDVAREMVRVRCERGADIVARMGFSTATSSAIRALDEHWDGTGHPAGMAGESIPRLARILAVAQTVEVFLAQRGVAASLAVARKRRGTWFDPELVDLVLSWTDDASWWDAVRGPEARALALEAEPADRTRTVSAEGIDRIAEAFAEIIDAKSPYTYQHSSGVAAYAVGLARVLGMDAATVRDVYRAALLHDIGKLGISNRILDKRGKLTAAERTDIERHPVLTWEILLEVPAFESFATIAATHHERIDGRGYPWRLRGAYLNLASRVLAVADRYEALTADRPYRPGMTRADAIAVLRDDAGSAVDASVVAALSRNVDEVEMSGVLAVGMRRDPSAA